MTRVAALSAILAILLCALSGCATSGQRTTAAVDPPQATGDVAVRTAAAAPAGGPGGGRGAAMAGAQDYRLGPLDVIEVSVFEVPELTKTVQVNAAGAISLPLIGHVTVGGKTIDATEREIERKLEERYLQSPQVSVFVKQYTSQRITVEGAVNSPGVFPIAGRTTLLQAIALAKGPSRTADESGVIIFRTTGNRKTAGVFDLNAVRTGKAPDPAVFGGDIVVVDQSAARTAWRDIRESIGVLGLFRPTLF